MICTEKQLNITKAANGGDVAYFRGDIVALKLFKKNNPSAVYIVQMGSQCEMRRSPSLSPVSHDVALLTR